MIITAHGGALKTGRNTQVYFDTIKEYKIDAIEVDIFKRGETLYLSHASKLCIKKTIKLDYALDFCKKYNVKINCDVKRPGLVKPVLDLAKKMAAEDYIYFTGFVLPYEIKNLTAGELYANDSFFLGKYWLSEENLPAIKKYLDSFNNPRIKGINVDYKKSYMTKGFYDKARELNLDLSIYTVDDKDALKRIMDYAPANITTNIVDTALEMIGKTEPKL